MLFRNGRFNKAMFILLGGLSCNVVTAACIEENGDNLCGVVTLSGGPVWESAGKSQTIFFAPNIFKEYVADTGAKTFADIELFFGAQFPFYDSDTFFWQAGLALALAGNAKLSGDIFEEADPRFGNYTYEYKINHKHIAIKGKLLMNTEYTVLPWISGSIGYGFNRSFDYTSTPTICEAVPTPNFESRSDARYAYTLGVGIQKTINPNWQVGIGYEYANWGNSLLGPAPGQIVGLEGLAVNNLSTNGVLLNFTYIG